MSALPAVDAYLEETVVRDKLVGLAAGIVIDDELVWSRGYGLRDREKNLPVEADTAFGIGSITKPVTGMAILMLRDRGRLGLDSPAVRYLPALEGLVYPTADSPLVTIRHLLTHTSGLPRMGDFVEASLIPQTRESLLASLDGLRLERSPGVARSYSNLGVQLLGPLIDAVETDHRVFIRDELLDPIGMSGAGWSPEDVGIHRLAMPYELDEQREPQRRPHWRPGAGDAAGGLYASVEDLAAFAIYNLAAWPPDAVRKSGPLRAATVREAHTSVFMPSFEARRGPDGAVFARARGSALGFSVYSTCRYEHIVAHAGKTVGHRASLHILPRHGVAIILLSNLSTIHSSVLPRDGEAVLDLLDETGALQPRAPTPSEGLVATGASVGGLLSHWDEDAFVRTFSADYRFSNRSQAARARFGSWRSLVGACHSASVASGTGTYAGVVELDCDAARLHVELRVAPWDGHPVTSMRILGAKGMEPRAEVDAAALDAVGMLNSWSHEAFTSVFAAQTNEAGTREFLAAVSAAVGSCVVDTSLFVAPDGGTFLLNCSRGKARMRLGLDDRGQITDLELQNADAGRCR